MDDAAIHRVSGDANGNGDWLLCSIHSSPFHLHSSICWFTVDRHGLRPRDDKSEGSDDKSGMGRVLFVIARREHLITLR